MKLREYLKKNNIDPKEFAAKSDINLQNIYYWLKGTFLPNKFYQKLIEEATKGAVTRLDWKKLTKKKDGKDDEIHKN